MKPADNIEHIVKKLNDSTSAEMDERVLGDVLQALEQSQKATTPKRRLIMKSSVIKLAAAAAIIIAISVVINQFDNWTTNVAWADIAEQFESVPFFNITIYVGNDTSSEAHKIEIWKSENSRIRAHQGNNIIFADFTNGKEDFIAFDRTTKQPANNEGLFLVKAILNDLCPEGRFSLDTLINSFPSDTNGLTPVETADTAASRETIVFEAGHKTTPEWILIWALRGSKLPIQIRFRDPRSNECSDIFFNYSEKKDAKFFDPNTFITQ
ncbi:MAG: hypothetical protein JW715_13900 [Sedimentisphaerales bacterium]|nr:hypothetical protein [Sedimentisphaerales bacterium]